MANYYCEYCGHKFPTARMLAMVSCLRHPNGSHRGNHKLYEGNEKPEYTCKYCGRKFKSMLQMCSAPCFFHPDGANKGTHRAML